MLSIVRRGNTRKSDNLMVLMYNLIFSLIGACQILRNKKLRKILYPPFCRAKAQYVLTFTASDVSDYVASLMYIAKIDYCN